MMRRRINARNVSSCLLRAGIRHKRLIALFTLAIAILFLWSPQLCQHIRTYDEHITNVPAKQNFLTGTLTSSMTRITPFFNQEFQDLENGQETVDYIARYIDVKFRVVHNWEGKPCSHHEISFKNTGLGRISTTNWNIYLKTMTSVDSCTLRGIFNTRVVMQEDGLELYHVEGTLYRITPDSRSFLPIMPGETRTVKMYRNYPQVSKFKVYQNWYVTSGLSGENSVQPRTILSTMDENLDFVESFTSSFQWKYNYYDKNNPLTPRQLFEINKQEFPVPVTFAGHVIPTPLSMKVIDENKLQIHPDQWSIYSQSEFIEEAKFLSDKIKVPLSKSVPNNSYIKFSLNQNLAAEGYTVTVKPEQQCIDITANSSAGIFYAIQTVLSLLKKTQSYYSFPNCIIKDKPRFEYRGVHLDVARNFMPKEAVIRLLDIMAMYKLNKFHFHLSDDEGWRLQITGFPELTEFGSNRCHDTRGTKCLMPQYASGPYNDTSGFYTKEDYREILSFAKSRHIEVIPELDLPGHARAAIKSMEQKYKNINVNRETLGKYLLSEKEDKSIYRSVQLYGDGFVNVCIKSTYAFVHRILKAVKKLHSDIQPLTMYHLGGDEIVQGAWSNSPACNKLITKYNITDLKLFFIQRFLQILEKEEVDVGLWEDSTFQNLSKNYDLAQLWGDRNNGRSVHAYLWNNHWETGRAFRVYPLANAGYKVVMSQSTHLYFDHPYEFHPEERGNGWSTAEIPARKVFGFRPLNVFANADKTLTGQNIRSSHIACPSEVKCKLQNPENIAGMQGHLWTEMVHSQEHMFYMYFPRVLALAERAWHKAIWEYTKDPLMQNRDWRKFAYSVGMKELRRLDNLDIRYRVPTPGAIIQNSVLQVNCEYAGLTIQYSTDSGTIWSDIPMTTSGGWKGVKIYTDRLILVRTLSSDRRRHSRIISVSTLT